MSAWGRPTYSIVKLRIKGNLFFDAVPDENENLSLVERYWKNLPNL